MEHPHELAPVAAATKKGHIHLEKVRQNILMTFWLSVNELSFHLIEGQ